MPHRWGYGIPSTSPRATTRCPGGKHDKLGRRWGGTLPPGHPVVGLRQADGMPSTPECRSVIAAERLVAKHLTQIRCLAAGRQLPARAATKEPSSSTSVGTSTATDDHGRSWTCTRRWGTSTDNLQEVKSCCFRLRNRRLNPLRPSLYRHRETLTSRDVGSTAITPSGWLGAS
jgi:hypothetical protein